MKFSGEYSLVDLLFSFILLTLLAWPILRLNTLDTFSFSDNAETLKAVRVAQNILERVLAAKKTDPFPREFTPTEPPFEYRVTVRPSDLDRETLQHFVISIRWGSFFKNYYALHALRAGPRSLPK